MRLKLPYPPSVNTYYRYTNGRAVISAKGRAYKNLVANILLAQRVRPKTGDLCMFATFFPPDRHRRDLDNVQKALWDALECGGAYENDSQIKDFRARMCRLDPEKRGFVIVTITQIVEYAEPEFFGRP